MNPNRYNTAEYANAVRQANERDYHPSMHFDARYRAPDAIHIRRYCPVGDPTEQKHMKKVDRLNRKPGLTGTLDDGSDFIIFTGSDADKFEVERLQTIVNFKGLAAQFTPTVSLKRNDEGKYTFLDEDIELTQLVEDTRYRYTINVSDVAAEELMHDTDTIKYVKSFPEMNMIEFYYDHLKFTHTTLIYQILTIAKTLYNTDRESIGMPVVTDTVGKPCKHTVQVLDVAESLISSSSDLDWINLQFCDKKKLFYVIDAVLTAAGYSGGSYTDGGVAGVYTVKTSGGGCSWSWEREFKNRVTKVDKYVQHTVQKTTDVYDTMYDYIETIQAGVTPNA